MAYPCFCHYGYGHGLHDLLDEFWIGHAGHAALRADVCRNTLKGHDGAGASLFCNSGLKQSLVLYLEVFEDIGVLWHMSYLFGIDNIHYHSTFQHLCQSRLHGETRRSAGGAVGSLAMAVGRWFVVEHIRNWEGGEYRELSRITIRGAIAMKFCQGICGKRGLKK